MKPHPSVVVFDGVCHLCNGWVRFLLRRDEAEHFVFAPMQSEIGRRLLREHGLDPDAPVSFLLLEDSIAYTDTVAISRVLRRLGGFWHVVAVLLTGIPGPLRDSAYRFAARHRYRLFGRRDQCMVPSPEVARRFVGLRDKNRG